jgi:hypothetical protein
LSAFVWFKISIKSETKFMIDIVTDLFVFVTFILHGFKRVN